ncbi:MBL fold metallo-hydrolase [Amphibiibacter pelophylacis]|uniref:MBL fold metallo-hydrolase n=1 Tax=Amphibiibacter pelophylacis TaxID=1799477 RepID=A0ACC6P5U2_9BURK
MTVIPTPAAAPERPLPPRPHEHELALHYPLGDLQPAPGEACAVADGVLWVRMTLPFALNHINLWLVRDRVRRPDGGWLDGWAIVDCGTDMPATRDAWEAVFAQHLQGLPVVRVIVTHMHPDHMGLAHWLVQRWAREGDDLLVHMSLSDWVSARNSVSSSNGLSGSGAAEFFRSQGLSDPVLLDRIRARGTFYSDMVPAVPDRYRRLVHGQTLPLANGHWRCIAGYGHAPEHIALFEPQRRILLAGDMVLPRISTNVSVFMHEPEGNPLALFLRSLDDMADLPDDTLVLPAHGRPFTGLHTRREQLQEHHRQRLAETLAFCRDAPRSAAELMPVLFRRDLDMHQTTFAMGETLAHLHLLWHDGQLQRRRDAQGVWRFSAA